MGDIKPYRKALLDLMVIAAVADGDFGDRELNKLSQIVSAAPVFRGMSPEDIRQVATDVVRFLEDPDGIEKVLYNARETMPRLLRPTAYALVLDVIAADLEAGESELEYLALLRESLAINELESAALEYAAKIRHRFID